MRPGSFAALLGGASQPWPGWPVFLDFTGLIAKRRYFRTPSGTSTDVTALSSTSRTAGGYAARLDGSLQSFGANAPRLTDRGYYTDASRTNPVKFSTDLTQSNWVKSGVTAARVTGPDLVLSSASSLTLSASGAGTAVQSLTGQTTGTRLMECWLRLRSGNPMVELSVDGSTFETKAVMSVWTQFSTAALSLGAAFSPSIRITGSAGDAVDVFAAAACLGSFPTSPIVTSNASITRGLDDCTVPLPSDLADAAQLTILVWAEALIATLSTGTFADISDNSLNNRLTANWRLVDPSNPTVFDYHSGITLVGGGVTKGYDPQDAAYTMATHGPVHCFGFTMDRSAGRVAVALDGGPCSEVTNNTTWPAAGMNVLRLGRHATGVPLNGYLKAVAVRKGACAAADLQALTGSYLP
jgi:hypothetical protein